MSINASCSLFADSSCLSKSSTLSVKDLFLSRSITSSCDIDSSSFDNLSFSDEFSSLNSLITVSYSLMIYRSPLIVAFGSN
uniref:Uncharacterized protein n=1 Tax=Arundo donax TaxID=35708 RepID=A0A0A9CQJ3_ARUDO